MTSARARRRQRRGRCRKVAAQRHPSGRIVHKPPEPNQIVIAQRKAMLPGGDITKAENWPDLCLARGWLTEERHQAFSAYCSILRAAQLGLPTCKTFSPDRVKAHDGSDGNLKAQEKLRAIWGAMSPRRAEFLFSATQHWPQFVMWMVRRGYVPSPFDGYRDNLFAALDTVTDVLQRFSRKAA